MAIDLASQLHEVLNPVVTGSGLFLEDVHVAGPARKRVVQVTVDLDDGPGGVDSDRLSDVSRAVSAALDTVDDILEGAYLLEVTTPGVSRPLTDARHFRRAQGRLVTVQTSEGIFTGRVIVVDGDAVHLREESRKGGPVEHTILLATIKVGHVEVELRRPDEADAENELED